MALSSDSSSLVVRSTGVVVLATILGRITGFGREWLVAHILGTNSLTDAYYAAFTLPTFVSYLVAGGFLGIILIPIFTKYMTAGQEEESWRVFSTVMTVTTLALTGLVLIGEIFTSRLATWIAPGFPPDQQELLIKLIRILLPSQIFMCLGGLLAAVHNAKGRFMVPGLAPIVYNCTSMVCSVLLYPRFGVTSFAVGVVAGAAVGFFGLPLVTLPAITAKLNFSLAISHPGVRQFFKLSIPMMLALSVDITDTWIVRWFGSYLVPGSITWLTYARFICVVPVAILAHAAGIASYPYLAQLHANGKFAEFARAIATATKSLILVMLPISALTIVLSKPLIQCVFTYTRLTQTDVEAVAAALACFSIGMLGRGTIHIVVRGFNAAHNTLTPAIVGTALTFITLPLYWFCARTWQYLGLAIASSIVVILFVVILMILLFRESSVRNLSSVAMCLLRVTVASVVGGLACRLAVNSLQPWIPDHTIMRALVTLIIGTAVGFPVIILLSRVLGVKEIDHYCKKVYLSMPRFATSSSG